jgi:PKD repeat protein
MVLLSLISSREATMRKKYFWLSVCLIAAAVAAILIVYFSRATENRTPVASFQVTPGAGDAPLDVQLDGTASSDPDGRIAAYAWDFGDGQSGTGPAIAHHYATPGTFTVTLTVTDDRGDTHSVTKTVLVSEAPSPADPPALIGAIEPPDGATVRDADTWVRWSGRQARGRVR